MFLKTTYINGLLAVYELNCIDLLRDVFIWAYERSCALYSATRHTLGEPDPFRLRYRNGILETVVEIVKGKMNKKLAVETIKTTAFGEAHTLEDQAKFIEKVEIELRGLHQEISLVIAFALRNMMNGKKIGYNHFSIMNSACF